MFIKQHKVSLKHIDRMITTLNAISISLIVISSLAAISLVEAIDYDIIAGILMLMITAIFLRAIIMILKFLITVNNNINKLINKYT